MNLWRLVIFFQVCILIFTLSCNYIPLKSKSAPDPQRVEVYLNDSVEIISFNKPSRFDTAFSWVHYSDCNTCNEQKHRFQSKKNPVIKETGLMWTIPKDSIDRFTISYMKDLPFHVDDTAKNLGSYYHFKERLKNEKPGMDIVWDTIYKINDHYFSIYELQNADSIHRKEVSALTTVHGNEVIFSCELMTGNNDSINRNYFNNSINLINSIMIKNGK